MGAKPEIIIESGNTRKVIRPRLNRRGVNSYGTYIDLRINHGDGSHDEIRIIVQGPKACDGSVKVAAHPSDKEGSRRERYGRDGLAHPACGFSVIVPLRCPNAITTVERESNAITVGLYSNPFDSDE